MDYGQDFILTIYGGQDVIVRVYVVYPPLGYCPETIVNDQRIPTTTTTTTEAAQHQQADRVRFLHTSHTHSLIFI